MGLRGLRDIRTYGTLAREGRLVSVARDWHQINKIGRSSENESWDGNVDRMIVKRSAAARRPSRNLFQDLVLERKTRATLIKQVQESITDMDMFAGEKISGALAELRRLKVKLSQLESA